MNLYKQLLWEGLCSANRKVGAIAAVAQKMISKKAKSENKSLDELSEAKLEESLRTSEFYLKTVIEYYVKSYDKGQLGYFKSPYLSKGYATIDNLTCFHTLKYPRVRTIFSYILLLLSFASCLSLLVDPVSDILYIRKFGQ